MGSIKCLSASHNVPKGNCSTSSYSFQRPKVCSASCSLWKQTSVPPSTHCCAESMQGGNLCVAPSLTLHLQGSIEQSNLLCTIKATAARGAALIRRVEQSLKNWKLITETGDFIYLIIAKSMGQSTEASLFTSRNFKATQSYFSFT